MSQGNTISFVTNLKERLANSFVFSNIGDDVRTFLSDGLTLFAFLSLMFIVFLAIFGPMLTPYEYDEYQYEDGELQRFQPPSSDYLLGTTQNGYDVLSRLIYGARPTIVIGFTTATIVTAMGLTVGLTAGYLGGRVEEVLMRGVDLLYGVPFIPTAIMFIAFFGMGFWTVIIFMGIVLWRTQARVYRSEVLQLKERPYVRAAQALGASSPYIVLRHILPNMMGIVVLLYALGVAIAILISAGLAFLGLMSPFIPSWGIMLRNAYSSGRMLSVWWWTLPPGLMISLIVLSTYLIGRGYERIQESKEQGVSL